MKTEKFENILMHLKNIYNEGELNQIATTKDFLVVRKEGNRAVKRHLKHYNLDSFPRCAWDCNYNF